MSDYENEYEVTIKAKVTYKYKVRADDSLYAIADAFENRTCWQWVDDDVYEVSVKEGGE